METLLGLKKKAYISPVKLEELVQQWLSEGIEYIRFYMAVNRGLASTEMKDRSWLVKEEWQMKKELSTADGRGRREIGNDEEQMGEDNFPLKSCTVNPVGFTV